VEGCADPDADGIPAWQDTDSDGDGVLDQVESPFDSDSDGKPDFLDTDSDNDGLLDGEEAAAGTNPRQRDTDGDGLSDYDEVHNRHTNPLLADSDGDGYSDLVEVALGTDANVFTPPSDPALPRFYFVLTPRGPIQNAPLDFATALRQVDVQLNLDTTLSMADEISQLQQTLTSTVIPGVKAAVPDVAFGVSHFEDFPFGADPILQDAAGSHFYAGGFGSADTRFVFAFEQVWQALPTSTYADYAQSYEAGLAAGTGPSTDDKPFELLQRVTTDQAAAQSAVNRLTLGLGGDDPEAGYEALRQIALGTGITYPRDPSRSEFMEYLYQHNLAAPPTPLMTARPRLNSVPPFDATLPGGNGLTGGAGFRQGSLPVVVHITDAPAHAQADYVGAGVAERNNGFNGNVFCGGGAGNPAHTACTPLPADRQDAVDALRDLKARVVGVASQNVRGGVTVDEARSHLEDLAVSTGATVAPCVFDVPPLARPPSCPPGQCCTGVGGAGRAPMPNGQCPLVFGAAPDGTQLGNTLVTGISTLVNFTVSTLSTRVVGVMTSDVSGHPVDTACFIKAVIPVGATNPYPGCAPVAVPVDLLPLGMPDGELDGLSNVTPGSTATWRVVARNDTCVVSGPVPQVFRASIEVLAEGVTTVDVQQVVVVVPPGGADVP
jgi:hypothetical protein